MFNTIKAVCVIIGTMIGAGFASGREIYIFFNAYGENGIVGILIASILTGILIYKVLKNIKGKKIESYNEYIESLGAHSKVKEILGMIIDIFLLISFYVMIAGFCAYFKQEFNVPTLIIGIIISSLCYFTFMNKIDGVTKINIILIPILIIMILEIGVRSGFDGIENLIQKAQTQNMGRGNWLIASIEYASYNSILLIPILLGLKKYSYGKEKTISIASGFIFFVLAMILYKVLTNGGNQIKFIDLPLIYVVKQFGKIYQYICGIIIIAAIFTSAIAAGYGFLQNSTKTKKSYKNMAIAICASSIFIVRVGFSSLVNLLYPVFGLISFGQILYILKKK